MKAPRIPTLLAALLVAAAGPCFALAPFRMLSGYEPPHRSCNEEEQNPETPAEIEALSPRKAEVLESNACYTVFSTADGREFSIGSPAAESRVVEFLHTLEVGTTWELPRAFPDLVQASPAFDTAEKIKAMPPCKATVEHVAVHDARLRTGEGKLIFIGGEKARPEDERAESQWLAAAKKLGMPLTIPHRAVTVPPPSS